MIDQVALRPDLRFESPMNVEPEPAPDSQHRADAEFLRSVLSASADCIKVLDLDGNLRFMNEGALRLMEVDDFSAIEGCPWSNFWHGEGHEQAEAAIAAAKGGATARFKGAADTMSGVSRYWDVQVTPMFDAEGRAERLLVVARDVTDASEASETLLASREKLELATRAAMLGQFDYWPQTGHLEWDDRCRELFGLSPGVPVSYEGSYLAGLHPDDREMGAMRVLAALDPGGSRTFDLEYRTIGIEDGIERFIHARGTALFDGDVPQRLIGAVQDVTEDRRARLELQENVERVQLALSAGAIIGTWLWDIPSDRFSVDEPFAKAFGLDPALGRNGLSLAQVVATVHPDDQAGLAEAINEAIERGGTYFHQYRVRRADGRYYWIEANGRVDHGEDGTPLSFPGVLLDLEVRRAVEAERDRAIADLRSLTANLETRVAERTAELLQAEEALRQSQKLEAVGQLTGGVAHDFNNLLTIIRSSVDFLKREDLPPARRTRYVEAISDTVERASKLTNQLLAFARRQPLKPQVFDVSARVRDVSELIRPLVGARIAIKVQPCERPCHTEADVSQFETALVNLCVNARDAMNGEGTITLSVREVQEVPAIRGHAGATGDFIAVSVADTGQGIAADQIASIFEPFFTTKEVGKGTGLGLSQVFGFTKQSGGEVSVESELGAGAVFTLYLPRVQADGQATAPSEQADSIAAALSPLCVLVVEDNEHVGRFADEMLQDLGYRTRLVGSAHEALRALEPEDAGFDVVFSDVIMPGMNGVDLARELRRRYPDLPVVLTSGYSTVLAQEGAHGFELLRKPYSIEELSRVLRRVSERPSTSAPAYPGASAAGLRQQKIISTP